MYERYGVALHTIPFSRNLKRSIDTAVAKLPSTTDNKELNPLIMAIIVISETQYNNTSSNIHNMEGNIIGNGIIESTNSNGALSSVSYEFDERNSSLIHSPSSTEETIAYSIGLTLCLRSSTKSCAVFNGQISIPAHKLKVSLCQVLGKLAETTQVVDSGMFSSIHCANCKLFFSLAPSYYSLVLRISHNYSIIQLS